MEHRYSQRIPAQSKLLIFKKSMPVAMGRLQNISRSGLFAMTDYRDVALNQIVEIEFLSSSVQLVGNSRFKGFVVHRRASGFGLEIDDYEYRGYSNIWRQLRGAYPVAAFAGFPGETPVASRTYPL